MLLCSWWSSSGFIMIFIWVHHVWMDTWISGRVICFSYEFLGNNQKYGLFLVHQKVTFPYLPRDWCRIDKVDSASSCPCFEGLCGPCIVPTLMRVYLWLCRIYLLCFCFFLFTYCTIHKVSMCRAEHFDHQNVPFVSLRMICKTTIWCNQILIVKQQWSAVNITSMMIFSFGIFLGLQCS